MCIQSLQFSNVGMISKVGHSSVPGARRKALVGIKATTAIHTLTNRRQTTDILLLLYNIIIINNNNNENGSVKSDKIYVAMNDANRRKVVLKRTDYIGKGIPYTLLATKRPTWTAYFGSTSK